MKHRFFILGLAAVLFAACTVNEENHSTPAIETEEEFYATIEGATTRVYVDEDLKVLWHADDRVSIFNKYTYNQQYRFTGNTGANSGSFQKVPSEDFITGNSLDYVYAVYPYQETTEISNQGLLTVDLPATQSYAENSFGIGANTMISCSEGNELLFKNLCGYIMLKLYGDDVAVSSISLKGNNNEPLAGKASVISSVDGAPSLSFDSSATNEITLTFDTPVTLGTTAETATTFWLVVPPTTFEGGITLKVKTADGKQFEKSTTQRLEIARNTRARMGALPVTPDYAANVSGQVTCNGAGIPDVVVSDGIEVVKTDGRGFYRMQSEKHHGYVFISVPSGYETETDGIRPLFYKQLSEAADVAERVDFDLRAVDGQTDHTMLVFGDIHLANRNGDRAQFADFVQDVNDYVSAHPGRRIYALTLGDMTWDLYWKDLRYGFAEYLADANALSNLPVYHTIGNHDHSMYYPGDFETVREYKQLVAPTYYSFNVGNVHYVVLDNIECTNSTINTDRSDGAYNRAYKDNLVQEQLDWLRRDLAFVPKSTPLCLTMHAPLLTYLGAMSLDDGNDLVRILETFDQVQFFTGHTHKMYNIDNSSSTHVFEHNAGAVCATWWWSGKLTPGIHIAQDGAPGGYSIVNVNGYTFKWQFKGTGRPITQQFRTYDRNKIALTADTWTPSANASNKSSWESYARNWIAESSDNYVYINVWNYDPEWNIEVTEAGRRLSVTRVTEKDPLHLIAYTAKRLNTNSYASFSTADTYHMFRVQASSPTSTLEIKVTDRFGNVYTETMTRPKDFNAAMYY